MAVHISNGTDLSLYGEVGLDSPNEGFTSVDVTRALSKLRGVRARVFINSPGGDATQGFAIYQSLARYRGGVDTFIDGVAASAASVIFMAGKSRQMASHSKLMIHQANVLTAGNADDLEAMAKTLRGFDESIQNIYADVTGLSTDAIAKMMSADYWMGAEQAVSAGFATGIVGKSPSQIAAMIRRQANAFAARSRLLRIV